MKHADPPPLEENGNAEERADAALAEHGVRQLGAVDVLDDDRPLLRRHAPDEARADGDADVPRIRLFQAGGGALDEHVAVEQEDGGRVGGEDALHADEQLVEQLVERELRERGVGDRLESLDGLALSGHGLVRLGRHHSRTHGQEASFRASPRLVIIIIPVFQKGRPRPRCRCPPPCGKRGEHALQRA